MFVQEKLVRTNQMKYKSLCKCEVLSRLFRVRCKTMCRCAYCRQALDPSTGVTCSTDPAAHPVLTDSWRNNPSGCSSPLICKTYRSVSCHSWLLLHRLRTAITAGAHAAWLAKRASLILAWHWRWLICDSAIVVCHCRCTSTDPRWPAPLV